MKKIVALPFYEHAHIFGAEARKLLQDAGFHIVTHDTGKPITQEELALILKDAYAAVAGVEVYSREILATASELRVLARYGVGLDNIDIPYCKMRGIRITRSVNDNAVAETAMSLLLAIVKNTTRYDRAMRAGIWGRENSHELSGKTVGLIGFGKIGRRFAELLGGFGVEIIAYDPFINQEEALRLRVKAVALEDLLSRADVISLHVPYSPQTHHLIDETVIRKMKDGVYFLNTARGALVDEPALICALKSGKISAAGLDVYEQEPVNADNPLLQIENVVLLPHIAAASVEGNYNTALICARSIIAVSEGREPEYPII